ncbi:MAG: hypothetical protein CVT92_08845 [Bacteroidetes bacterium HGW-Bacteroidetes-1]|jgi:PKD repeat protein|nr:MAG: hypothetical protein CVT92_08845 [Bacteroidetes bacterium HGW-Bacteroidetes-1]
MLSIQLKQIFALIILFILTFHFQFSAYSQVNDTASYPYWIEMMQDRNANFFSTKRAFELFWTDREITKGSGYKPFKRWEYMMDQRVSTDGILPPVDREMKAYKVIAKQQSTDKNLNGDWTALGPFTVPSGYNGYRGLGRINSIAFHPVDPQVIYTGAPAGGLWVSNDHGISWTVLTDHLPTLGVSSIVMDYRNPNTIFIGTGDRDAGDAPGLGVWRSADGGNEWIPWNNGMGNATVGRLIQHPTTSEIILAATSSGIYRTTNAGDTWERSRTGNFKEIVFKPDNAEVVYAATGGTFYRSENNGITFTAINNGLPGGARGVIGVSAANPEVVYFLLTNSESYKGIYRSVDAGLSFELRSDSPNIMSWDCNGGDGGQAWYDLDIAVDPNNADIIIAGGVNSFRSIDGGLTWAIRSHWYGGCGVQSVHADLHVLEYSPLNNRLYVGNDGGIYWSQNGGANWEEITNGLVISQAYKIGQSQTNPDYVINGYQDNGTSAMNSSTWLSVGGGDGMECAYDPEDDRYSYSTLYYGDIFRNFNNNQQGKIAGQNSNGINEGGGWVTPFVVDHDDGNTMFVGYKNIWRSTNIKASGTGNVQWAKISTMNNSNMNVLAQSKANTTILYAASGSKLYYTDNAKDASVVWITRTGNLPSNNTITALETHPMNNRVVYMAQQTQIYKSENNGESWQNITDNLNNVQINSIAFYKNSNEGLYLGTDIGVFYRDASMGEWLHFSSGMPASAKVTEIEIYYNPSGPEGDLIRAGTYGRGLWSSTLYYGSLTAGFEPSSSNFAAGCSIDFEDKTIGTPFEWLWTFEGGTPSSSTLQNPEGIVYETEGLFDVTLSVSNPLGTDTFICVDCINVVPATAPDVAFEATSTVGCAGMVVQMTDMSENCPTAWNWTFLPESVTFVDGTNSSSQNPIVQFNENVNYTVSLTATNGAGSNTLTKSEYIHLGGYPLPYVQDFNTESFENIGWEVDNPDNGRSWAITSLEDGSSVAWMNFFNYTTFQQRDFLLSPALNLSGMENAYLSFEYAYAQRYFQIDSLIVSISIDCGTNWERIYANGPDGQGVFETTTPTLASFIPVQDEDWCRAGSYGAGCPVINISQYAGNAGVKIRFETYNQYGNNLYLANLNVSQMTYTPEITNAGSPIIIYPNPAHSSVNVIIDERLIGFELRIKDIQGRLIRTMLVDESVFEISLNGLSKGVYFLEVNKEGGFRQKLILH